MSLAVLARKTRAKRSKKYRNCFVLNMSGRGGVIGGSAKYRSGDRFDPCSKCHSGSRATCCGGNMLATRACRRGCSCWHGGSSQPAPQMSYRTYINRKANGAYRPGGSYPCCKTDGIPSQFDEPAVLVVKPPKSITWKQSRNLDSSEMTEQRKLAAIQCSRFHTRLPVFMGDKMVSNKLVAKATACPAEKEPHLPCCLGLKVKSRLGYTRINHNWCESTKASACAQTASDHTALVKSEAFSCNCPVSNGCQQDGLTFTITSVTPDPPAGPPVFMTTGALMPECVSLSQGRTYQMNIVLSPSVLAQLPAGGDWVVGTIFFLSQSHTLPGRDARPSQDTQSSCLLATVLAPGPSATTETVDAAHNLFSNIPLANPGVMMNGDSWRVPDCPPDLFGEGRTGRWTALNLFPGQQPLPHVPFKKCFDNLKKPMPSSCK